MNTAKGAFWLVVAALHWLLPLQWGDDAVFMRVVQQRSLVEFLQTSSRPIIDTITYIFASYPFLWRLFNPLVLFALWLLLTRLLHIRTAKQQIFLGFAVVVLSMSLVDAGFMATTINYLWPMTFALYVAYTLLRSPKRLAWLRVLLCIPALLYAMNMQQMALMLPIALAVMTAFAWWQKQFGKAGLIGAFFLLSTLAAAFSFYQSALGNNARIIRETHRYFPAFGELSLLQRSELGFTSTMHGLAASVSIPAVVFLVFCAAMLVVALRRPLPRWQKALCALPLLLTIVPQSVQRVLPITNPVMSHAQYLFSPGTLALFLLLAAATVVSILTLTPASRRILTAFVLVLGFGSRMLMGFSPTVWASGYRTFYLLLFAVGVAWVWLSNPQEK